MNRAGVLPNERPLDEVPRLGDKSFTAHSFEKVPQLCLRLFSPQLKSNPLLG